MDSQFSSKVEPIGLTPDQIYDVRKEGIRLMPVFWIWSKDWRYHSLQMQTLSYGILWDDRGREGVEINEKRSTDSIWGTTNA